MTETRQLITNAILCRNRGPGDVNGALEEIKSEATHVNVISREYKDNAGKSTKRTITIGKENFSRRR